MFLILRSAPRGASRRTQGPGAVGTRKGAALAALLAGLSAVAAPAEAHGFGQRYDLPLPLSLYLLGTAAAVVLSFVVVALFARHTPGARGYPRLDLTSH